MFLLLIITIALTKPVNAQIMWGAYSQSYPSGLTDKPGNIGLVSAINKINNEFLGAMAALPHLQGLEHKP